MTRRTDQLAASIRDAVQRVLDRGLQDPRVAGMITVTGVSLSPDLATATIGVSIYPADKQTLTLHGLKSAAAHIRHEIADALGLRRTPELAFRLDATLKKQATVLDAIARATADSDARAAAARAAAAPGKDADA
ncbi:MAG: 30S ribosome-binding factor RbfA [Phycisphaerales bacterium]